MPEAPQFEAYRNIQLSTTPITFEDRTLRLKASSLAVLQEAESKIPAEDGSLIYQLAIRHSTDTSLRQLAAEFGVNRKTISALLRTFGIPILSDRESLSRKWNNDPEFRQWHKDHATNTLNSPTSIAENHDTRSARLEEKRKDPEFEAARLEGLREKNKDPEVHAKRGKAIAANWEKQEFRDAHEGVERAKLAAAKQNPEFQINHALGVRNSSRMSKNSIQGERADVGFTQSTYEANMARLLTLVGADFQQGVAFSLEPKDGKKEAKALTVDFLVNTRGRQKIYEIVTGRSTQRLQLLERLSAQYPALRISIITEKRYKKLKKRFQPIINADPRFAGWETPEDNLRSNPAKFANS